jgi:thiaminase
MSKIFTELDLKVIQKQVNDEYDKMVKLEWIKDNLTTENVQLYLENAIKFVEAFNKFTECFKSMASTNKEFVEGLKVIGELNDNINETYDAIVKTQATNDKTLLEKHIEKMIIFVKMTWSPPCC